MPRMERSEIILEEWFGKGGGGGFDPARAKLWFSKDEEFDTHLRRRFGDDLRRAAAGEYDEWAKTPRPSPPRTRRTNPPIAGPNI